MKKLLEVLNRVAEAMGLGEGRGYRTIGGTEMTALTREDDAGALFMRPTEDPNIVYIYGDPSAHACGIIRRAKESGRWLANLSVDWEGTAAKGVDSLEVGGKSAEEAMENARASFNGWKKLFKEECNETKKLTDAEKASEQKRWTAFVNAAEKSYRQETGGSKLDAERWFDKYVGSGAADEDFKSWKRQRK